MATAKKQSSKSGSKNKREEYEEQPGWANLFLRDDATGNQPKYTGVGLDPDGNEIQVAIWPKRAKTGTKYLRLHIEPPYESDEDEEEDDDDIPF